MLSEIGFLSGILSLVVVIIYTFIGLRIASKYFKHKQRVFILVGITWLGLGSPWWPSTVSFLIAASTGGDGLLNTPEIYFLIGNVFLPVILMVWMTAVTDLLYKDKQKLILLIFGIYSVMFEVIFFSLLLTDPTKVGILSGAVDVNYQSVIKLLLISVIIIILITGTLFGRESLKSDNKEIKLKGKLITLGFILFVIGAALDSSIDLNIITLPITRIILITSAIVFYGGFILPAWMKKIFLKE